MTRHIYSTNVTKTYMTAHFSYKKFNSNYSNIISDDSCYVIVNGRAKSHHIFPEAMEILRQLPTSPINHPFYELKREFPINKCNRIKIYN